MLNTKEWGGGSENWRIGGANTRIGLGGCRFENGRCVQIGDWGWRLKNIKKVSCSPELMILMSVGH